MYKKKVEIKYSRKLIVLIKTEYYKPNIISLSYSMKIGNILLCILSMYKIKPLTNS